MLIERSERPGFHQVTFTWSEDEPDRPAKDVLVRLIALTDHAQDDGELDPYLLVQGDHSDWTVTLDLPSELRTSYQLCPLRDEPLRGRVANEERWTAIMAAGIADPGNQAVLPPGCTYGNPGPASLLELPEPWGRLAGGMLEQHRLGDSVVSVSAPVTSDGPLGLAVFFDGRQWADLKVAGLLDRLIAEHRIAPVVAVLVESIDGRPRHEGLTLPNVFLPFLTEELLPFVKSKWPVCDDPRKAVLVGQSLGSLAAIWAGWQRPDLFGAVIGQSSSFWWPGGQAGGLNGSAVIDTIESGPPAPLRFFLEAGCNERDLLEGNRRLASVLSQQDYQATYREYQGGHDYACWLPNLTDALPWAIPPE